MTFNLLMVAPRFAPVNTTGHYRTVKFVKYLREFDIEPTVVTLETDFASRWFGANIEYELLDDIPSDVEVVELSCEEPRLPKSRFGKWLRQQTKLNDNLGSVWRHSLLHGLARLCEQKKFDGIYVSLPPFSLGTTIAAFANERGIPFIADFRDLWSEWCSNGRQSIIHQRLIERNERTVLHRAGLVVSVTEECVERLQRKTTNSDTKFCHIPNGFDGILPKELIAAQKSNITIGYIGGFYYDPVQRRQSQTPWYKRRPHRWLYHYPAHEDWLYRSPYFFLKSLAELYQAEPKLRGCIHFEHIGRVPGWLDEMVDSFGLRDFVRFKGFCAKHDLPGLVKSWDWALATSEKVFDGPHYCLPSKIFDYLTFGLPILGFVTHGAQRRFIEAGNLGICVDPDSHGAGVEVLASLLGNELKFETNAEFLDGYTRRSGARKLAESCRALV